MYYVLRYTYLYSCFFEWRMVFKIVFSYIFWSKEDFILEIMIRIQKAINLLPFQLNNFIPKNIRFAKLRMYLRSTYVLNLLIYNWDKIKFNCQNNQSYISIITFVATIFIYNSWDKIKFNWKETKLTNCLNTQFFINKKLVSQKVHLVLYSAKFPRCTILEFVSLAVKML